MAIVLTKLYGVQRDLEIKLKSRGIKDSEDLLALCKTQADVKALAGDIGLDVETLMALVNRANLARIRGIGEAYTMLLEAAGVKTLDDLARKEPDELRGQFEAINLEQRIVGRVPALAMVNGWVSKAQKLPNARL